MNHRQDIPTLFVFNGVPVKVKPLVLANLPVAWGGLAYLAGRSRPERPWSVRLAVGGLAALAVLSADLGHALAHTVSARLAGSPMDEIWIVDMPRTIYHDNDVPPRVHRMRALGGPLYSATGLLLTLLLQAARPQDSISHEVANWAAVGHGLILFGSLAPLPIVDGGVILKWTLVERGRGEAEADQVVKQASLATGAAVIVAGLIMTARRRWLPAVGLLATGLVAIGAAFGKIR